MFLVQGRPTVTAMLKSDNPDGILAEIQELRKIGVDTFGLQIDYLKPEYRKNGVFEENFFCHGRHALLCNQLSRYRSECRR